MPIWSDFFKLFTYANEKDPLGKKKDTKDMSGAGVSQADALQMGGEFASSSGSANLHQTYDMIDTTSLNNRTMRYKEYERLRNVPEIEMAITVISDEACIAGDTHISTPFGNLSIKSLADHKKDERFLVYGYDFQKKDYTLGWAFNPRLVKKAKTVEIIFDNGTKLVATPDHRILKRNGTWIPCGELQFGDELMPFYRIPANQNLTKLKTHQHPRIYTHNKGWVHERQFIDDWKSGKINPIYEKANRVVRMIAGGLTVRQIATAIGHEWKTVNSWMQKQGFSYREVKNLAKKEIIRKVVGINQGPEIDVYDLSVEKHFCFATDSVIVHNCQKNEDNNIFKIECKNEEIYKELNFIMLHRKMLNLNREGWKWFKNLCLNGDWFLEYIINPDKPSDGILKLISLPVETMYRVETIRGKLVEYQQSKEGVDYKAIASGPIMQQSESELNQSTAIRFAASQICHMRIGDDRKTFYPYGQSLIEPARAPAHQLRLMEDAMVVYRLCIRGYDKIKTRNSWKYMKDITTDDIIYSFNQETGKLELGRIIWHGLIGQKQTYQVRSRHTAITGTYIHPILVWDKETQQTSYVTIKDLIPGRHYFLRPIQHEFEAKKIDRYYKPKQAVLRKNQLAKYRNTKYADKKGLIIESLKTLSVNINPKNIQKCWSYLLAGGGLPYELGVELCERFGLGEPVCRNQGEKYAERIQLPTYVDNDFAELLGFLFGDGCINWNKKSAKLLFAAGIYPKLNEKYQILLKTYFGRCKFQQDNRLNEGLGMYCVNSVTACEILDNLGFKGNAHTKRVPSWIFNERPEIRKAFVKGFSDAEGDKRGMSMKKWNTTIRLCNRELVDDIKIVWESLGLHCSKTKQINEPERWIKGSYVPPGINWEIYLSETEVPFHDEIISVSAESIEDVYDLTVDHEDPNFLCNGVPVHNTRAPERRVFYIDVGQLPPFKAEAFLDRLKDQFRKRKVGSNRAMPGANQVEERWQPPAADEDYWIPIRPNANTRIETLPGACLSLDTKIPLLDGTTNTLKEIIQRFENGEKLWSYSCNPTNGKIVPGPITWAGVTKTNAIQYRITLDNGEFVDVTPDHKFPIIQKGYVRADELKTGDSLIPFNTRNHKIRPNHNNEYQQIYDVSKKSWVFSHRMIAEFFRGNGWNELVYDESLKNEEKNTVHHVDYNRFNNNPENLSWMNGKDHYLLHKWLSSEYAQVGGIARAAQIAQWKENNDSKYEEFVKKSRDIFSEWRKNLSKEDRKLINEKISSSIKNFWKELNNEDKEVFLNALKERGLNGKQALKNLLQDEGFKTWFSQRIQQGWKRYKNTKGFELRSLKISESNKIRWENKEYKNNIVEKQTIVYPKELMDFIQQKDFKIKTKAIEAIQNNIELEKLWRKSNEHIKRSVPFVFSVDHMDKMMRTFGYKNWKQFKKEKNFYNHKVTSIEILAERSDVGTLTIDGNDSVHGCHTFALNCGVFTKNSNLGEIDDAIYFRNKLFTALNFPKNYLSNEDSNSTRITLSAQDVKFARMIERLQSHFEDGLLEIAERHLQLRGYPEEQYEDLKIKMTPPSDWRELSRNEVVSARFANAGTLKSGQLMSDYDIYKIIMKYNDGETDEMLARLKLQKLEDLKLQVMAQNPQLLGVGIPGQEGAGGQELGAEAGGPAPQLSPDMGAMPPGGAMPPPLPAADAPQTPDMGGEQPPAPEGQKTPEGQELEEPEDEDIKKFDLEIQDYESEQDHEDRDRSVGDE